MAEPLDAAVTEESMTARMSTGMGLVLLSVVAGTVYAETMADCINARIEQRKMGRAELDREAVPAKATVSVLRKPSRLWHATEQQIEPASSACRARVQRQAPRPPAIHWKYGDPSPVPPDGRRNTMSCSGKVLGMYNPGGAVEMEMKTHLGNCFANDNPWLLLQPDPAPSSTSQPSKNCRHIPIDQRYGGRLPVFMTAGRGRKRMAMTPATAIPSALCLRFRRAARRALMPPHALEDEVWAAKDEDEPLLRPEDVLIQRGTYHAWSNRTDRVARRVLTLIDAEPLKGH